MPARVKDDDSIPVPGAAPSRGRIANHLHRAAGYVQLLQLSVGEKTHRLAVRSLEPEGKARVFCLRYLPWRLAANIV